MLTKKQVDIGTKTIIVKTKEGDVPDLLAYALAPEISG